MLENITLDALRDAVGAASEAKKLVAEEALL